MTRFVRALPFALLLGCSTPPDSTPLPVLPSPIVVTEQVPPPEFQRDLPLEQPQGHFCQLGRSCMALDPRPFEACLVSGTKRCVDKVQEPLLVNESSVQQPDD
jgi:hypothetical protein